MSKRAEQAAKEIYKDGIELLGRRDKNGNIIIHPEIMVGILRNACRRGYEQAEKDILSKFTKEHLEGLKWIERTGISTQPVPYHKYCKDLYKVLEELLKE